MPSAGLKPAAAISRGRALQRVTSGGEEKVQHMTDDSVAGGEIFVGVAIDAITDATTDVNVDIAVPGEIAIVETGAAITVAHQWLTTDGSGRFVTNPDRAANMTLAFNEYGETASGAGEYIRVRLANGLA